METRMNTIKNNKIKHGKYNPAFSLVQKSKQKSHFFHWVWNNRKLPINYISAAGHFVNVRTHLKITDVVTKQAVLENLQS